MSNWRALAKGIEKIADNDFRQRIEREHAQLVEVNKRLKQANGRLKKDKGRLIEEIKELERRLTASCDNNDE